MKKIVFSISGLAKKHPRKYIKHVLDLKFINLKYKNFQNEKYLNSRFRKTFEDRPSCKVWSICNVQLDLELSCSL
jgi:hypothetical protein